MSWWRRLWQSSPQEPSSGNGVKAAGWRLDEAERRLDEAMTVTHERIEASADARYRARQMMATNPALAVEQARERRGGD